MSRFIAIVLLTFATSAVADPGTGGAAMRLSKNPTFYGQAPQVYRPGLGTQPNYGAVRYYGPTVQYYPAYPAYPAYPVYQSYPRYGNYQGYTGSNYYQYGYNDGAYNRNCVLNCDHEGRTGGGYRSGYQDGYRDGYRDRHDTDRNDDRRCRGDC